MATASYDLVILNHTSCKPIESLVQELLVILDKVGDPYLEYKLSEALLFEQNSSVILGNINQAQGEIYQEKFSALDVKTELRPSLQLVGKDNSDKEIAQYTCPSCQHTQSKQQNPDAMNTCVRCGVVGEKLQKNARKKEVYQLEKHKLERAQNKQMQEARARAHHDEEKMLRTEAQKKLGLKSKRNYKSMLAGLGIVTVVGASAYFIVDTMKHIDNKREQQAATAESSEDTQQNTENNTQKSATDTPQQAMLTIQAGNGSIIVNNDSSQDNGKGGSKGTTSEATVAAPGNTNASGINETANANSQQTENSTSSNQASTQTIQQQESSGSTMQLAAVFTQQPNQNKTAQDSVYHDAKTALSTEGLTRTPLLANVEAELTELNYLKNTLQPSYQHSEQFFKNINRQQFEEHQYRLQRLLKLGKPDLALIFADGIEDSYLASLLVLEIARYEKKANNTQLNDSILLSMKGLAAKAKTLTNQAMLNASLSQAYDFTGDKKSSETLLKQSVQTLAPGNIGLEKSYDLLTQIDQNHREFGNQKGADFIAKTLINLASALPENYHLYHSRIYTHLAASALKEGQQKDATEWLHHVPVKNAQSTLLSELEVILTKRKAEEGQLN